MRNLFFVLMSCTLFAYCSPNNVETDNTPEKFFKEKNLTGSFALLNNANETFKIYNLSDYKDATYSPGTAFNVVNALIAIETGVLTDENTVLPADSVASTLKTAFDKDAVFFDTLAARIGKERLQLWLDSLHYGNAAINNDTTSFWKNGSLQVTSDEQLGLITSLHFSHLPFQKRTQAVVSNLLHRESNSKYTLAYNKGMATHTEGFVAHINGWIIENKHVYFFSQTTKSTDAATLMNNSEALLRSILKEYGYFEGKK